MALKTLAARTSRLDRLVIVLLLAMAGGLFWLLTGQEYGERLLVERGGAVIFTAPLATEQTVALDGPLGKTVLEMRAGSARILSSPCPGKDCMAMGAVSRQGALLACIPNHLLVRVEGRSAMPNGYDLLSR